MTITRRSLLGALVGLFGVAMTARKRKPKPVPTPTPTPTPTPVPGAPIFGTLATDPAKAAQEYAAGLRLATHETGWDRHEKSDGVFSQPDLDRAKADRDKLLAAGMQVALELGLHYPPAYVPPLGRYQNQFGGLTGMDTTWGVPAGRAERYITRYNQSVPLKDYAAIRMGIAGCVEALFPNHNAAGGTNGYWAFSAAAQAAMPSSLRGLKPGMPSMFWADWYSWYIGQGVAEAKRRMALYRSLGFHGQFYVLMPGDGIKPRPMNEAIAANLTKYGDTMARGAAWAAVGSRLAGLGVTLYCSSAAEYARADYTDPTDISHPVTDPWWEGKSSMRWITGIATANHLPAAGENPGRGDSTDYAQQPAVLCHQAKAAGWASASWAHDRDLFDSTSGVTLAQFAAAAKTA